VAAWEAILSDSPEATEAGLLHSCLSRTTLLCVSSLCKSLSMRATLLCFALATLLAFVAVPAAGWIQTDLTSGQFVDSTTGSTRIFHGVNVVFKEPPYLPCYNCSFDPQLSLNAQDIENLTSWGQRLKESRANVHSDVSLTANADVSSAFLSAASSLRQA
jgi:hypothetical protein